MSYVYITEPGSKVQKRGNRFVIGRDLEVLMELPKEQIEGLVLIDSVQISSAAITELLKIGVPVTWISSSGEFFGRLESTCHVNVFKHQKQVQQQGTDWALKISKKMIFAKISNQIVLLRRYNRREETLHEEVKHCLDMLDILRENALQADSFDSLRGYEGIAARYYFQALGMLVPDKFKFIGRSKRPPKDAFNSMLSFGYTLLMYEMYTAIENEGLHPYFGILHALKNHHPALASDLMEEWRPVLIDSLVMSMVKKNEIKEDDFIKAEESSGIFLTREGRRTFLQGYENKLRRLNQYNGEKESFRKSLYSQVTAYSNALMHNNADEYEEFILR